MKNVHEYILNTWDKTIRDPNNKEDAKLSNVKLPNKYTTPCIDDEFKNFYYWDSYFTNLGLLEDNRIDDARNNLNIMRFFITIYGFVPNADHLIFGSQPPFFTRGVYDLYQKTKDLNDITYYIDYLILEMNFWEFDRKCECGLNQYKCGWTNAKCKNSYNYFVGRVGGLTEEEKEISDIEMTRNFFAIAESGWDVTLRYKVKGNRFAALNFANIDLNSILYDAEMKISEMLSIINRKDEAKIFLEKANKRKELMDKLMKDKDSNIYLDYNFIDDSLSQTISAVSFYPYAMGLSKDKEACLSLFKQLDNKFGISTAINHGDEVYMQWDYPHMWPSNTYFAYLALKNVGLEKEANIVKEQYMHSVMKNYKETGKLWEKYNTLDESVSKTIEYETPSMMGWTAGVFEYFYNN